MDVAIPRRFPGTTERSVFSRLSGLPPSTGTTERSVFSRLSGGPPSANRNNYGYLYGQQPHRVIKRQSNRYHNNTSKDPYCRPRNNAWVRTPNNQPRNPNYGSGPRNSLAAKTECQLRKSQALKQSLNNSLASKSDDKPRKRSLVRTRGGTRSNESTEKIVTGPDEITEKIVTGSDKSTQKIVAGSDENTQKIVSGSSENAQKIVAGLEESTQKIVAGSYESTRKSVDESTQKIVVGSEAGATQNKDVRPEDGNALKNTAGLEDISACKEENKVCKHWLSSNCVKDDKCHFLHSWSLGDGFSVLAKLEGHEKAITGMSLPTGSDKLYTGSIDGTARIWDCHTGKCASVISHGDKIGSLISEGPWIFIGLPNVVKALNVQTSAEYSLEGPVGQVNAMAVENNMLFAGAEDGVISVWEGGSEANPFNRAAPLEGHSGAVICLTVGRQVLFSGSVDRTIREWELNTLQCTAILNGHSDTVMSLLCWSDYLLSCSLDQTIKVWGNAEDGHLEVAFTHTEEQGLLALSGMNIAEDNKPILFCSRNDNSVQLYELPSFAKRGQLFSKQEVGDVQTGPHGLFFTGDASGTVIVWKWLDVPNDDRAS